MKAITFEAPQSRNLNFENIVSISDVKAHVRRRWLHLNLAIRTWSRHITDKKGNFLLWVMSIAVCLGFVAAIAGEDATMAVCATIAVIAMVPEMTKKSYDKKEEEL